MLSNQQNKELKALLDLLDEPNELSFSNIESKLISYGVNAIDHLKETLNCSFNSIIQERIENIISRIKLEKTASDLKSWTENAENDLLHGYVLVSAYQYPDLNKDVIQKKLDKIIKDAWLELNNELTALEKIKVINHIIFKVHGFKGNMSDFNSIEDNFVTNILNSKTGNHISLGILYMIIAGRLNVSVYGVDLPKQFILSYVANGEVLFYINPFKKGVVFTNNEVKEYIKHLNIEIESSYFNPCNNIRIIERLLEEIYSSYTDIGYLKKAEEIKFLLEQI